MESGYNIEKWLEHIKKCKFLEEPDLKMLCEKVKELLLEESNVQPVAAPITLCGGVY